MNADAEKTRLPPDLARSFHRVDGWRNVSRILMFLSLYAVGVGSALALAARLDGLALWVCVIPCWLLAGASLHGISLFTHEAVHGTLARDRRWNAVAGALCAWPVWQNYSAYRVLHLRHHADLGGDHDPDHYSNYTRWTWGLFILNWLRLLVGYPVYLVAIPLLGWRHGDGLARLAITAEVALCAGVFWCVWLFLPMGTLLHAWLGPMLMINFMVNVRGMSQHTLLEHPDDEVLGTRSILTGRLVRFFMCNENYHLEHHLYPGIPWHQLPEVHGRLAPELRRRGAPMIGSYLAFVREFISHSIKRGPWRKGA